ncbi:Anaphase-promoting complex subunit 4 [Entomortierella lignicola]|nr:Anaphase-promoting complex subunit 4 [Entomortierella lignicola]
MANQSLDSQEQHSGVITTRTFKKYTEKPFTAWHRLEAWCPTADLIALVSQHNELGVYRSSWRSTLQCHWSVPIKSDLIPGDTRSLNNKSGTWGVVGGFGGIPPPRTGTSALDSAGSIETTAVSLTWRPDGKMIAQFPKSLLEALPALSPIPLSSTQQHILTARSMFNKNLAQRTAASASVKDVQALAEKTDEPNEESSEIMNVLFVGDKNGQFKLRLFGGFETNVVSLLELLQSFGIHELKGVDILKTDIQLNLSELVIIAVASSQQSTTVDGKANGQRLLQITITSDLLDKYSREIRILGLKRRPVQYLLKYLSDGLKTMQDEFKRITQLTQDCVDSIQQSLDDNGETTTPSYEFVQLLMTGIPSPSLDKYLQQELRRHGLRRWQKSAMAAYSNIQRVAFECLLPACERLLIHFSDILGCSRWDERYRPLELKEALIYNCIKIVGDFVAIIERLFIVLKIEVKQFHEFENWLEHVLEILQPTIRDVDDQGDNPRCFPPVDYTRVSEYLRSGLSSKGLKSFFQEADQNMNSESVANKPQSQIDKDEDSLCGYDSMPSYPIMYSFSEELQNIVRTEAESMEKKAMGSVILESSRLKPAGPKNPFAGVAITAALASRGFGKVLPSRASQSTRLFSNTKPSPSIDSKEDKPTRAQKPPLLTLQRHLKIMTRHCQSIFEGPSEAVAKSMKISHALDLLGPVEANAGIFDMKESPGQFGVATMRYCYHVGLNDTAKAGPAPEYSTNTAGGRRSPPITLRQNNIPTTMVTRLGQKRRASNPDIMNVVSSVKARIRSPAQTQPFLDAPSLENLSLRSPRKEPPIQKVEDDSGSVKSDSYSREWEVAFFSLRELGSNDENSNSRSRRTELAVAKGQGQDLSGPLSFEIRDMIFLDDDNLGLLLCPTSSTVSTLSNNGQDEKLLVSVPLQDPLRPYHPLNLSDSTIGPLPCLFDVLSSITASDSSRKGRNTRHTSSTPTSPLTLYTLPIARCVALSCDSSSSQAEDIAHSSLGNSYNARYEGFLSDIAAGIIDPDSSMAETNLRTRELEPYRIACNERENKRGFISVHSISSLVDERPDIQLANQISVYEL